MSLEDINNNEANNNGSIQEQDSAGITEIHLNYTHYSEENGNEREQEPTEIPIPVYSERTTITIQPRRTDDDRIPMPISSENWRTTTFSHFIPLSGLDFLIGADHLIIQQTVELQDILAFVESENRYLVKVPLGETLYYAAEASSSLQRVICGSARSFDMKLFDQTRQHALILRRKYACSYCCCGCYLQKMEIYTAGGVLLGKVEQEWTLMNSSFAVCDADGTIMYVIQGPALAPCRNYNGAEFRILSRDGLTQQSSIIHEWNNMTGSYNISLTFPGNNLHQKMKAVFLGAAFLLEYMFFEESKKTSRCKKWCCM